jgi:hypothetical protein
MFNSPPLANKPLPLMEVKINGYSNCWLAFKMCRLRHVREPEKPTLRPAKEI